MTNLLKKTYKRIFIYPNQWYPSVYLLIVSSCGNKGSNQTNEIKTIGFSRIIGAQKQAMICQSVRTQILKFCNQHY